MILQQQNQINQMIKKEIEIDQEVEAVTTKNIMINKLYNHYILINHYFDYK